jgi:hypothetical protein
MSVIVKNMKMPKNCGECPFIFSSWGIEYYCHLAESSTSAEYVGREKMTNCPLIELPPHGRLIDADALKTAFPTSENATNIKVSAVRRAINRMSTIIEAERNEE